MTTTTFGHHRSVDSSRRAELELRVGSLTHEVLRLDRRVRELETQLGEVLAQLEGLRERRPAGARS